MPGRKFLDTACRAILGHPRQEITHLVPSSQAGVYMSPHPPPWGRYHDCPLSKDEMGVTGSQLGPATWNRAILRTGTPPPPAWPPCPSVSPVPPPPTSSSCREHFISLAGSESLKDKDKVIAQPFSQVQDFMFHRVPRLPVRRVLPPLHRRDTHARRGPGPKSAAGKRQSPDGTQICLTPSPGTVPLGHPLGKPKKGPLINGGGCGGAEGSQDHPPSTLSPAHCLLHPVR